MKYIPDRWLVLEITSPTGEKHRRVFGSWLGGYLDGDSWRMNSGVTKVVEKKKHYNFHGESGSVYKCYKGGEGTSAYTAFVVEGLIKDAGKQGVVVEVVNV